LQGNRGKPKKKMVLVTGNFLSVLFVEEKSNVQQFFRLCHYPCH